ncbi:chromosome partitioning protein [Cellulomonas sp. HZM]|uniref:MinD/ParA family ATP-binding protein n=1 Tax=Cellulomonas sp. HZM TaxID=1454010 RepID=UPI000493B224|nr:chromosome partitioning protein [Cellulomonas sp. HZM]
MADVDEAVRTDGPGVRLPEIEAEVREDGTGRLTVDGRVEQIRRDTLAEAGAAITTRIAELADEVGSALPVSVRDPEGVWSLLIHPDGTVDEAPTDDASDEPAASVGEPAPAANAAPDPSGEGAAGQGAAGSATAPTTTGSGGHELPAPGAPPSAPASSGSSAPSSPSSGGPADAPGDARANTPGASSASSSAPTSTPSSAPSQPTAPSPTTRAASTPLPTLDDLLAARHPVSPGPAEHGWRVGMRRVTGGLVSPGPGRAEQRRRVQQSAVRRGFDGPKTIVVVNPKGGAHKTTATLMLAATFGLERGGYTLAWDNNETRGTLGWRSAHAGHTQTAVDLLRSLPTLGDSDQVRVGDLDAYVRTQSAQQFDVLASDEDSASAANVDATAFRSLHDVLSRFYRVLVVDTGNNMRASNWQAAVAAADQIVVVSTIREDTAQSAAWALDALRATGHEEAVRHAVTILSEPDRRVDKDLRKRLRSHFGALTRAIVEVPHDKALVDGGPLDYDALSSDTRDAWLRATAVVADGL